MKALSSSREIEMTEFHYWQSVDSISESVLLFRRQSKKEISQDITNLIDFAVKKIEDDLQAFFLKAK